MIAKTTSAPSFFPLAAYLSAGSTALPRARRRGPRSRHLASDDLAVVPVIMEATAFQNAHVERPCYHSAVAFDVEDRPTRAQMEQGGDHVLDRLGLADYQAMLVAHNDREYAHVHHGESCPPGDRRRLGSVARPTLDRGRAARCRARIWNAGSPGRLAPSHELERSMPVVREASLTWGERRQAARTGELPLLDRARAALPDCRAAISWPALDAALAQHGLAVERTTRGLTITNGARGVSASRVAPELVPPSQLQFGERFPEREATPDIQRLVDVVRALAHDADLERAAREAAGTQQLLAARTHRRPRWRCSARRTLAAVHARPGADLH